MAQQPVKGDEMDKFAIVVMSEPGEDHPGGQGRMLHALTAAEDFKKAGVEARIFFHGIGVQWLPAFEARQDRFCGHYGPLFDSVRDMVGGACNFCAADRFGAADAAQLMGVPLLGDAHEHHSVATLTAEGYQLIIF